MLNIKVPGDYFAPHRDGSYIRSNEAGSDRANEISYVTCQIYLNEGFDGGATRFMSTTDESIGCDVIPKTGSVLLFQHDMYHEGSILLKGNKYAIRTDVMYSDKENGHLYTYSKIPIKLN